MEATTSTPRHALLLAAIVERSHTCLAVVTGQELRFTFVNPAYQAIAPARPMVGRTYAEVFPDASASGSRERFLRVLDSGEPWEVERWRAPVPGKPDATWQGRVVRLPGAPGEPPSALVVIDDVTAQARAEAALREETEKYRSLFEHSIDAVYLAHRDGTILDANGAACLLHGMTVDEIRRAGRAGLVVTDDRHAAALGARDEQGSVHAEMTVRRKDGTTVPVEVQSVLLDPARRDSPAFVISRDVSGRKRREDALRAALDQLRESEDRFRAVFESAHDAVVLADPSGAGQLLMANPAACRMFGYTAEEFAAVDRAHMVDASDPRVAQFLAARGLGPHAGPAELTYVRKDGTRFTGEVTAATFQTGAGEPRTVAIIRDVTERKRAEEAAALGQAVLAQARALAHLGAWWIDVTVDPDDLAANPLRWTDEVYRIFGYEPDEVPVTNDLFFRHVHPDDRQRVVDAVARSIATRGQYVLEHRIVRRDGAERAVVEHGEVQHDGSGRLVRIVGAVQDVTDRKRVEHELRESQDRLREANERLREADRRKDEFLGMLSHELRNPLAPIRNALYILDRAEPHGQQASRAKDIASRQVAHLTRLVDDLLDVTRIARGKIELRRADLDLAALARRTAEDHRALMQERGLELAVEVADAAILVNGDDTRLAQVLGNLLSNAAKFTPTGGRVTLSAAAGDDRAVVHVRDTGPGIAADVLPMIFEPFTQGKQTLARSEGGLGLGLALVKALVALHGGDVAATSGDGGTDFVVTIPLAARTAAARPTPRAGPAAVRHRVLVVDDNRDGADTLAQLVALLGHDVEVAYDGPSALEAARARPPDVVLCDLGLPGMDGYEVARRLRATAPGGLRLVAVSGYAQPEDVARAAEAGFDGHVAKPPDADRLAALLR